MNKNYRKALAGLIAGLFLLPWLPGGGVCLAEAADCKALAAAVDNERTLMTRKTMSEDAMKACPRDAGIIYQHGYTLERLRKYDEALRSYKKAISISSGYAKAYFSIGDIQMIMKNYEEAAQSYETGLQHEPGEVRAVASLKEARKRYKVASGKALASSLLTASSQSPAEKTADSKPAKKPESKPEPKVAAKVDEGPTPLTAPILRLQVPFVNAGTELSPEAKDVLSVVVGQAMRRKDMQTSRFELGGYTDALGDSAKNQEISKQRAEAVQQYLTENFGIGRERLPVAARGENRPRESKGNPANQELNGWVEFSQIR